MSWWRRPVWAGRTKNEAPMPADDVFIGDPRSPYSAVAVLNGIHVYTKPDLPLGHVELRDRYGVLIGTIMNVASISVRVDGKKE